MARQAPQSMLPIEVAGLTLLHGNGRGAGNSGGGDGASGRRALLQDVDCRIDSPGITAILGPNGAGKSLFMRCLHGLARPSRGEIRLGGARLTPAMQRRQSFVFQHPVMLRRSTLENLRFVARNRDIDPARAMQWLERVGLADCATRPARILSGGEKQRLALARALLTNPAILFLDEATANLDPASVQVIETITHEAKAKGTKVLFVTHDTAQARRMADDVLFLARGAVLEHGSAEAFFAKPQSAEARAYLSGRLVI